MIKYSAADLEIIFNYLDSFGTTDSELCYWELITHFWLEPNEARMIYEVWEEYNHVDILEYEVNANALAG